MISFATRSCIYRNISTLFDRNLFFQRVSLNFRTKAVRQVSVAHGVGSRHFSSVPRQRPVTLRFKQEPNQHLKQFGRDLTEEAKAGRLDPVIGRDETIQRCLQVLARRTKNNPILIGEAGVGKTAIAEGLAQHIVSGQVYKITSTVTRASPIHRLGPRLAAAAGAGQHQGHRRLEPGPRCHSRWRQISR